MGTGAEVDVRSEDRRPAPCLAPRRLGSGMTSKAWAFRKRAVLDPSQDFAQGQLFVYSSSFPSRFLFFHLLPFSGCLLHPAGGARRSGEVGAGGGSCQTDPLPNRGYSGGSSARETVSHTSEAVRLGRRGRTDCGTHVIHPRRSAGLLSCLRSEVPGQPASRALPAASASSC